jgi:hypothetical protein
MPSTIGGALLVIVMIVQPTLTCIYLAHVVSKFGHDPCETLSSPVRRRISLANYPATPRVFIRACRISVVVSAALSGNPIEPLRASETLQFIGDSLATPWRRLDRWRSGYVDERHRVVRTRHELPARLLQHARISGMLLKTGIHVNRCWWIGPMITKVAPVPTKCPLGPR